MTARPETRDRIPLNTFAIAFGFAGLAELWTYATPILGLSRWIPGILWVVAATAWVWLLAAHAIRGIRVRQALRGQLRHPAQGPIAALVPVVAMLLGVASIRWQPVVGYVLIVSGITIALLFAALFVGRLSTGGLAVDAVHGGYFLPTVAGGYIASYASAVAGWRGLAEGLFGFATIAWVTTLALLIARLALRPVLPDALQPTLAILIAPPAVGGLSLFALYPGQLGFGQHALAVTLVIFLIAQIPLLGRYKRLPFTLGFWSFTFPAASAAAYATLWLKTAGFSYLVPATWALCAFATALLAFVAGKSVESLLTRGSGAIEVERALDRDDDRAIR